MVPTIATAQHIRERHSGRGVVTLPETDLAIEVKRIDPEGLIVAGRVNPADVDGLLRDLEGWKQLQPQELAAIILENPGRVGRLIDACVAAACVQPRVSLDPQADPAILWIDDLLLADKVAILTAANRLTPATRTVDEPARSPEPTPRPASEVTSATLQQQVDALRASDPRWAAASESELLAEILAQQDAAVRA